jgi:hypothetical protein
MSPHWSPADFWIGKSTGNGNGLLGEPCFPGSPWRGIYLSALKTSWGELMES